MKFKVGDSVLVTTGKDKGKKSTIVKVLPKQDKVIVADANMYTRHRKAAMGQPGEKVRLARPLATANVAILNDKGQQDRIGYRVAKDGSKERIFKKTGKVVPTQEVKK